MLVVSVYRSCRLYVLIMLALFLTGCALHYTDKEGNDRLIGLVSIKVGKNDCVLTNTAQSIGVSVDTTADSGGINLGMRSMSKSYIKNVDYLELQGDESGTLIVSKYRKSARSSQSACTVE